MARQKKTTEIKKEGIDPQLLKFIDAQIADALAQIPKSATVVGTKTEFIHSLSQYQAALDELEATRIQMDEEIRVILGGYVERLASLQVKVIGFEKAIEKFALYHRDALLAEFGTDGGKTVSVATGDIVFREKPPTLRKRPNVDEEDAAKALIDKGHDAFVVTKFAIIKEAARMQWAMLESVLSPFFTVTKGGESVLIYPTKTEV